MSHSARLFERATITDANGDYTFSDLTGDSYIVREVIPDTFGQTFPGGTARTWSSRATTSCRS